MSAGMHLHSRHSSGAGAFESSRPAPIGAGARGSHDEGSNLNGHGNGINGSDKFDKDDLDPLDPLVGDPDEDDDDLLGSRALLDDSDFTLDGLSQRAGNGQRSSSITTAAAAAAAFGATPSTAGPGASSAAAGAFGVASPFMSQSSVWGPPSVQPTLPGLPTSSSFGQVQGQQTPQQQHQQLHHPGLPFGNGHLPPPPSMQMQGLHGMQGFQGAPPGIPGFQGLPGMQGHPAMPGYGLPQGMQQLPPSTPWGPPGIAPMGMGSMNSMGSMGSMGSMSMGGMPHMGMGLGSMPMAPSLSMSSMNGLPPFSSAAQPIRTAQSRSVKLRLLLVDVIKSLQSQADKDAASDAGSGKADAADKDALEDGFQPIDKVRAQVKELAPEYIVGAPVQDSEIDVLFDTEGDAKNGGGNFEVKQVPGGDEASLIRWVPEFYGAPLGMSMNMNMANMGMNMGMSHGHGLGHANAEASSPAVGSASPAVGFGSLSGANGFGHHGPSHGPGNGNSNGLHGANGLGTIGAATR